MGTAAICSVIAAMTGMGGAIAALSFVLVRQRRADDRAQAVLERVCREQQKVIAELSLRRPFTVLSPTGGVIHRDEAEVSFPADAREPSPDDLPPLSGDHEPLVIGERRA